MTPTDRIAEALAEELGAVWALAIRQRARLGGVCIGPRQAYRPALRAAARRGWLCYPVGGVAVRAMYGPAGLSSADVERLTGAPALSINPTPLASAS